MRIPKVYGQSREDSCFFCANRALTENGQGLPVCIKHKNADAGDLKCVCGQYVDVKKGKYGAFFLCMACGPLNLKKIKEVNEVRDVSKEGTAPNEESVSSPAGLSGDAARHSRTKESWEPRQDETVMPDDPRYFS